MHVLSTIHHVHIYISVLYVTFTPPLLYDNQTLSNHDNAIDLHDLMGVLQQLQHKCTKVRQGNAFYAHTRARRSAQHVHTCHRHAWVREMRSLEIKL